jgi:hypothetical protein
MVEGRSEITLFGSARNLSLVGTLSLFETEDAG